MTRLPWRPSVFPVDPAHDAALRHFGVDLAAYLGGGGEARVYALDDTRVLRVERGLDSGDGLEYMLRRQSFYARLRDHNLPFALPEILDLGEIANVVYAIERRLPGRSLQDRAADLRGSQRATALWAFVQAAHALATVALPDQPYGELLMRGAPILSTSWTDYLHARLKANLAGGYADLLEDIPDLDDRLTHLRARLDTLDPHPPKRLVHGDFGPANVLLTDDLRVSAVLDFGYATLAGDPRQDLACALAAIDLAPGYTTADARNLRAGITRQWGEALLPVLDLYRAYYAVYFCGCKADDPATYWWCVQSLCTFDAA